MDKCLSVRYIAVERGKTTRILSTSDKKLAGDITTVSGDTGALKTVQKL